MFHKITQGIGKMRRFTMTFFGKNYIENQKKIRQGACRRCGNCCKILVNCPFGDFSNSTVICKIYDKRFQACRVFPIDERCLLDVKLDCGFNFSDNGKD
jgi:uncharacterized protein